MLRLSKDRAALERAHQTHISQSEARQIAYAYLDEDELPVLDFTALGMRGQAWRSGRIRLPAIPTLGLVLHEVAHIIAWNDRGEFDHHGPRFVRILDGLISSEQQSMFDPVGHGQKRCIAG